MFSSFLPPLIILREAYMRYAFSRYAFLRDAYLRYAFSRYAYLRYGFYPSLCLKRVFALQLQFDAFPIWNTELACCYSALNWWMSNLDDMISISGYWILS